jgi:hypothetical protein
MVPPLSTPVALGVMRVGIGEILWFSVCWLFIAGVLMWGVLTEHRRGGPDPVPRIAGDPPVDRRSSGDTWVAVDTVVGSSPDVVDEGRLLLAAWLASRGVDLDRVAANDVRTEEQVAEDGTTTVTFLVRSRIVPRPRQTR